MPKTYHGDHDKSMRRNRRGIYRPSLASTYIAIVRCTYSDGEVIERFLTNEKRILLAASGRCIMKSVPVSNEDGIKDVFEKYVHTLPVSNIEIVPMGECTNAKSLLSSEVS